MSSTLPVFTPIEDSLFLTLCGRAPDNQPPRPILGDPMAEQVVGELGYDCGRFRLSASPISDIAHRARKLDQVARNFIEVALYPPTLRRFTRLAAHSTAVSRRGTTVLHYRF